MKVLQKIISAVLCFVVLCSVVFASAAATPSYIYTETGCYGSEACPLEYPITSRFVNYRFRDGYDFALWYKLEYSGSYENYDDRLAGMSRLWYNYYSLGDPEMWPEEYLDRMEIELADTRYAMPLSPIESEDGAEKYKYRVDGWSWDGRDLTVQCSGDFEVEYVCEYDEYEYQYVVDVRGAAGVAVALAFTDKTDGSLAHLGEIGGFGLYGEYRYGYGGPLKEGEKIEDYDGIKYTCTDTESFTATMPEIFDPEKHDIKLYFRSKLAAAIPIAEIEFMNPAYPISAEGCGPYVPPVDPPIDPPVVIVNGDVNKSGIVNLTDVSELMKYLAKWERCMLNLNYADANSDGEIDIADVSAMLKIIAGWENV